MNDNVLELVDLFQKCMAEDSVIQHFNIIGFGLNGVVLIAKNSRDYCIKTIYTDSLKEEIIKINKQDGVSDYYLDYLKDNLGNVKNLNQEFNMYKEISSYPSLKNLIPELFFPIENQHTIKYLILEFINGEHCLIEGLLEINDKDVEIGINEFKENGYLFGDKIEWIKKSDGNVTFIDFDSISKI
ncbi:hypothetical protein [Neobacillus vireti]|uniref:hypothetical protein n=1 Tax=Neobacillus vireti TaxID=220686 RepID=UPI002FFF085E